jgi:hypothetical protein
VIETIVAGALADELTPDAVMTVDAMRTVVINRRIFKMVPPKLYGGNVTAQGDADGRALQLVLLRNHNHSVAIAERDAFILWRV